MRNEKSSLSPWILFQEREDVRGEDGIRFPSLDTFLPRIEYPLFPLLCIFISEIGLMRREDMGGEKSLSNYHGAFASSLLCLPHVPLEELALEKMKKSEFLFTSF